jgi:hypothetical protein
VKRSLPGSAASTAIDQDAAVQFRCLSEAASGKVSPTVQKLHDESAKRWSKVYAALASTSSS